MHTQAAPVRQPELLVRVARNAALAALAALVLLQATRELWLAPTGSGTLLVLTLPPLLLCVAGLLRHRMRTFRWLSLLVWLYFVLAVLRATTDIGLSQRLALAEVASCLLLFAASVLYIRRRQKNGAALKLDDPAAQTVAHPAR